MKLAHFSSLVLLPFFLVISHSGKGNPLPSGSGDSHGHEEDSQEPWRSLRPIRVQRSRNRSDGELTNRRHTQREYTVDNESPHLSRFLRNHVLAANQAEDTGGPSTTYDDLQVQQNAQSERVIDTMDRLYNLNMDGSQSPEYDYQHELGSSSVRAQGSGTSTDRAARIQSLVRERYQRGSVSLPSTSANDQVPAISHEDGSYRALDGSQAVRNTRLPAHSRVSSNTSRTLRSPRLPNTPRARNYRNQGQE